LSKIIGVDLGTSNSCVAVLDERGPRVLSTKEGERTIPSIVAYTNDGVVVGIQARRQAVTNANRTIFGTKRLIGRKVNAGDVSWFARSAPFRVVAAPNGDAWVRIDKEPKSPQEVASHVLRKLKEVAEEALGEPVTRAVVTVPAYFNDAQRQATRDAGTIAGLDVLRILNEPTAAALAYGAHRTGQGRRVIAVFDLGGGTFDISIMAVDDGIFEVLATNGDSALGGDDWDRRIIEKIADEVFDEYRIDLTGIPVALGRLKEAAEEAKKVLTTQKEATISLPFLTQGEGGEPVNLERTITRQEFEELTRDLIDRLAIPCQRALSDAGLPLADIEEVLLVGGMSRAPSVQIAVEKFFGRKPSKGANPDEVVAMGAAAHAGILAGEIDDATLLDVTPHSIGIKVGEGGFATVIPRNSMLPVRERKLFATTHDNQRFVKIEIFQGESTNVDKNKKLGQVVLKDLPGGRAGKVRIELFITVDVEGILSVNARELRTGKEAAIVIQPSGGLSQTEMGRILERRRQEELDRASGSSD
jgi:molecular chaperone DnaK